MRQPPAYIPGTAIPIVVPDHTLIKCLTDHGMPAKDARALTANDGLRLVATRFYFDVADAKRGNKEAKERVDFCRHIWDGNAKRAKANKPQVSISVPAHL